MLAAGAPLRWLVARIPRRRLVPLVYRFFLVNLLVFFLLWRAGIAPVWVARVFYVWVSVYNLFVVTIFWSVMADTWRSPQGKRLFGFVAAGGSRGAIVGPLLTPRWPRRAGKRVLILLSAILLEVAAQCMRRLPVTADAASATVGGGILEGLRRLFANPFLLGIGMTVLLYTVTSTFIYLEQARILTAQSTSRGAHHHLRLQDLFVNVGDHLPAGGVTARIVSGLGSRSAWPIVPRRHPGRLRRVLIAPERPPGGRLPDGAPRVLHFAFDRPSREVLFTAVPREDKYKAKSVHRPRWSSAAATSWAPGPTPPWRRGRPRRHPVRARLAGPRRRPRPRARGARCIQGSPSMIERRTFLQGLARRRRPRRPGCASSSVQPRRTSAQAERAQEDQSSSSAAPGTSAAHRRGGERRARPHPHALQPRQDHPGLFPDVEQLHRRPRRQARGARRRKWDAVSDTSGYVPRSGAAFGGAARPQRRPVHLQLHHLGLRGPAQRGMDESAPVRKPAAGEEKSEEVARSITARSRPPASRHPGRGGVPGRATLDPPRPHRRPGDPTDRFTYWPVRIDRGGEASPPATATNRCKYIDSRDLGDWWSPSPSSRRASPAPTTRSAPSALRHEGASSPPASRLARRRRRLTPG
jgi:AAA family ATP:ADP antiporter